ncbi:MAG: MBL fold metallo-hydrolase [Lachnospiraceae bacterium]|nr:MBL fold metallo-hydrolase [Lachnospiraceae bacterium]
MSVNIAVNIQSSIRIRGSKTLYFDPWQIEDEPHDGDYVFITHEHYDHFSPEDIRKVVKFDGRVVIPASMAHMIGDITTVPQSHIVTVKPGEKREIARLMVETYPAYNQGRPFHVKRSGWLGYLVTMDAEKYFVSGDTDAVPEITGIKCDVAFLPIGGTYTMDATAAAGLTMKIHPKVVIPTHYGSIVGSPVDGDFFQGLLPRDIRCELLL